MLSVALSGSELIRFCLTFFSSPAASVLFSNAPGCLSSPNSRSHLRRLFAGGGYRTAPSRARRSHRPTPTYKPRTRADEKPGRSASSKWRISLRLHQPTKGEDADRCTLVRFLISILRRRRTQSGRAIWVQIQQLSEGPSSVQPPIHSSGC